MSAPAPTGTSAARRPRIRLADLVLLVVLGTVFGFLYWALVQGWIVLQIALGPAGDLAQHLLLGGWLLVAPIAIAIISRPLVGVAAELIASVIEVVFLGSPVGPLLFLAAALQGIGSELPFALGRYRRYGWVRFAVSGLLGAAFVFVFSAFRFGWFEQDILLLRVVLQLVSGVLLGGLAAKVIVDALLRTGVLDGFAIGRARREGPR